MPRQARKTPTAKTSQAKPAGGGPPSGRRGDPQPEPPALTASAPHDPASGAAPTEPLVSEGAELILPTIAILKTPPSKLELIIEHLRQPSGASLAGLMLATGWQVHSVRAALAAAVPKRIGIKVVSEKIDGVRRYRLPAAE